MSTKKDIYVIINNMTEQFVAGIIGSSFGLNGFVKVKSLSDETGHLLELRTVILRRHGEEQLFKIEESINIPPLIAMRFTGYDNPESVKALAGAELLVNREYAAALAPGEFYIEDLKGLAVLAAGENAEDRQILGRINEIIEGGGGNLAEIRLNNGQLKLVPFIKEFFSEINPEKEYMIIKNLWVLE